MKLYQIERRINIALDQLRVNDNYLLKNDIHEQAITHRIALYLEQTFGKTHDVDCEYNRDIHDSKRIFNYRTSLSPGEIKKVIPDIVVHKRGRNDYNLLIVEVKKSTSDESFTSDYAKLRCYTANDDLDNLNYKFGVFIKVHTNQEKYKEPEIVYFANGEVIGKS